MRTDSTSKHRLVVVLVLAVAGTVQAEELRGKVVGIYDGDTITVLSERTQVKV